MREGNKHVRMDLPTSLLGRVGVYGVGHTLDKDGMDKYGTLINGQQSLPIDR